LVRGHISDEGIIDSPVKNERGNYKDALTHFRCLYQIELLIPVQPYPTARYSLVEFLPKTGRMHQLRIHANKISHPIIGDPKYGNRHHNHMFIDHFGLNQLFLHAKSLKFIHPMTNDEVEVRAPIPDFWKIVLQDQLEDFSFFE
jgi:tRNA pseudouridine65 synthase